MVSLRPRVHKPVVIFMTANIHPAWILPRFSNNSQQSEMYTKMCLHNIAITSVVII